MINFMVVKLIHNPLLQVNIKMMNATDNVTDAVIFILVNDKST